MVSTGGAGGGAKLLKVKLERWGGETVLAEGPWGWAAVFKGIRKPLTEGL